MSFVSELAPVPESAFPCPPLRRRIGAGEGARGTRKGGDGGWGKQGPYGPRSPASPPGGDGRARVPGRLCSAGRSGLRLCPEYQRGLPGPRAVPAVGEDRARPLPDSPIRRAPSSRGRRARAGRAARAADSPPGPRASPRSPACAPPRARRPGRSPPARPRPAASPASTRRAGGTALQGPSPFLLRAPGPARLSRAAGASPSPVSSGRPGTEAAAGACSAAALQGAGCHDCGQRGARAHARARLRDSGPIDGLRPDRSPVCAADGGQGRRARPCGGQCAPWRSRLGSGTELGVVGGSGVPQGQSACQGDPAAASQTPRARRSKGRGAQRGRGRGAWDLVKWRGQRTVPRDRVCKVPCGEVLPMPGET